MKLSKIIPALSVGLALTQPSGAVDTTFTYPSSAQTGPSGAQFTFNNQEPDFPGIPKVNSTAWQWWYYDVVAPDATSSFVMAFFSTPASAFPFLPPGITSMDVVGIWGSFPNGTAFTYHIQADEALVTLSSSGSVGSWQGTGIQWAGISDSYTVTFNSPSVPITGSITLQATSPQILQCGPPTVGATMQIMPHVGWRSEVPTATGSVNLVIGGTPLQFTGAGYHDMNWGDTFFSDHIGSWFWGHGQLGPYHIVYFDTLTPDGINTVVAHVTLNGQVISESCSGVVARPEGVNSTYPPTQASGNPGGFHVVFDLGSRGTLDIYVTPTLIVVQAAEVFTRWVGSMNGRLVGTTQTFTGSVLFEEFRLLPG